MDMQDTIGKGREGLKLVSSLLDGSFFRTFGGLYGLGNAENILQAHIGMSKSLL